MRAPAALALLLALPALGHAAPDAGELLTNGGLDAWAPGPAPCPAGWTCSGPPSAGALGPSPVARSEPLAAAAAELGWLAQQVPATPGATYALRLWHVHPQEGCMAVLRILFHDAAGGFLARPTEHVTEAALDWREARLEAEAPQGAATATVQVAGGCWLPPGVLLVDDLSLRAR